MNYIFSLININNFFNKVNHVYKQLQGLSFDTKVIATTTSTYPSHTKQVCNDTISDIQTSCTDILKELISDYNNRLLFIKQIKHLYTDITNDIIPKYNDIIKNMKLYNNQLFQDTVSEKIYAYTISLTILTFINNVTQYFLSIENDKNRYKKLLDIHHTCKQYSDDTWIDINSGKPLVSLGYTNINNAIAIIEQYCNIVDNLFNKQFFSIIDDYKNKIDTYANKLNTLNNELSETIDTVKELDTSTLDVYKQLLKDILVLKYEYRVFVIMCELLLHMRHTVYSLLDSIYRARNSEPLKDITYDMGDKLEPTIIVTQAISNENLSTDKLNNNNDKDIVLTSIESCIQYIKDNLTIEEIQSYLNTCKIIGYPFEIHKSYLHQFKSVMTDISSVLSKIDISVKYANIFLYNTDKVLDIPEIEKLELLLSFIGCKYTIKIHDEIFNSYTSIPETIFKDIDTCTPCVFIIDKNTSKVKTDISDNYNNLNVINGYEFQIESINTFDDILIHVNDVIDTINSIESNIESINWTNKKFIHGAYTKLENMNYCRSQAIHTLVKYNIEVCRYLINTIHLLLDNIKNNVQQS